MPPMQTKTPYRGQGDTSPMHSVGANAWSGAMAAFGWVYLSVSPDICNYKYYFPWHQMIITIYSYLQPYVLLSTNYVCDKKAFRLWWKGRKSLSTVWAYYGYVKVRLGDRQLYMENILLFWVTNDKKDDIIKLAKNPFHRMLEVTAWTAIPTVAVICDVSH